MNVKKTRKTNTVRAIDFAATQKVLLNVKVCFQNEDHYNLLANTNSIFFFQRIENSLMIM